jgi:hypothetical protein
LAGAISRPGVDSVFRLELSTEERYFPVDKKKPRDIKDKGKNLKRAPASTCLKT